MPVDVFDVEALLSQANYRRYVDGAKQELSQLFAARPLDVFYERQLQVLLEDRYFHWITSKALRELVGEGRLRTEIVDLGFEADSAGAIYPGDWNMGANVRFFWGVRNRYWKSSARKILKLIRAYSDPQLTAAYGRQAEMLFDAALPKAGFLPIGENVNEYRGKKWTRSGHNLDRIFERDGVGYGAEIKNRLRYIDSSTLKVKLEMCEVLGLKPLFIARMMPKIYNYEVIHNRGGYALLFKYQLYPFHMVEFAATLRDQLGLPVDCPSAVQRGTIDRFLRWHLGELRK
jgi:hypothetical protein